MPSTGTGGDCGMGVWVAGYMAPICLSEDGPLRAVSTGLGIVSVFLGVPGW